MAFSIELSDLNGANGFIINGIDAYDRSGKSVSGAGDVNGDGFADLIIGAPFGTPGGKSYAGESYLVFGKASGFDASLDLSSLDGTNGFVINGIDRWDLFGWSVSDAGDINGDGFDDLVIGAYAANPNLKSYAGESCVVFGKAGGFDASLDLTSLNGTNGFVLGGIDASDWSGWSVSGAGDVNGDGIDDLIIGAPYARPNGKSAAGESYVVFGHAGGFNASFDLSSLDGTNGFVINGADSFDYSGKSVSGAGDVNGDGFADLIIGAPYADPNGNSWAGESYVVFGKSGGFDASLDLSALNGTNGFVINGILGNDRTGFSVSGAGDVNGDGFDDLIIGAFNASPNGNSYAGESYVVFGKADGFDASLNLSALDGTNGFVINGIDRNDASGVSVSDAGDVNGDGFDDLIIGAPGGTPNGKIWAGESYVVFGKAGGFDANLDLSSLDGTNGFVINGIFASDVSGLPVSGAGDVNDDGFDDLIIGARNATPDGRSSAGESYVVFGRANFIPPTHGDDLLIGADGPNDSMGGLGGNDTLLGLGGDDSLNGGVGNDSLIGGHGRDSINGHYGNDLLIGNQNVDTLRGQGGDDVLLGNDGADRLVGDAGDDTMTGGSGADRFIFRPEQAIDGVIDHDVITDYDPIKDVIDLKAGVAVEDHDVIGGNLVLTLTGGDQVELQGITNFVDLVFV